MGTNLSMENGKKMNYQPWGLVAVILCLTATMAAVHQFKIPVIMGDLTSKFSMSLEQAALSMSIFTFVGIFLSLPGGGFVQKVGPKNTFLIAAIFMAIGALIGAFSASSGMLIFSRGIEGVGYILITLSGPIAIAKFVEPAKIGSAMGIYVVWVSVGQAIASNLTPPLFNSLGYSGVWITYAVLSLAMGSLVLLGIKTRKEPALSNAEQISVKATEVFKNKNLWFFCLSYATFNAILMCVLTFVPTALGEKGIGVTTASFAVSLPMLLGIVASPIFGAISDKMRATKILHFISLFAMLPGAVMMFSSVGSLMYIGAFIIGIGIAHPAMVFASVGKVNPKPELSGMGVGMVVAFSQVGMFLGPMLMPYLLSMAGGDWAAASWYLIPLSVIGLIFALLSKFK